MGYKLAFFTLLAFWIWVASTLARQGMEPSGVAVFSLCCGYLSQVMYTRGWQHGMKTEQAFAKVRGRLLLLTVVTLLIFFASLVLTYNYLATYTRGMLIAAGFYFVSYWLPPLSTAWKSMKDSR